MLRSNKYVLNLKKNIFVNTFILTSKRLTPSRGLKIHLLIFFQKYMRNFQEVEFQIYVARRFGSLGAPQYATMPPLMSEEVYRKKYSLANLFTPSSQPSVSNGCLRALWVPFPVWDPTNQRAHTPAQPIRDRGAGPICSVLSARYISAAGS